MNWCIMATEDIASESLLCEYIGEFKRVTEDITDESEEFIVV